MVLSVLVGFKKKGLQASHYKNVFKAKRLTKQQRGEKMEKNTKNLLFINSNKQSDKSPDYEVWIGDKKYVFWMKESKSGKKYGYGKEKKAN